MRADFICLGGKPRAANDRIIVNCAIGNRPLYTSGQAKLKVAWERFCPDAWALFYNDLPDGCPAHAKMQYAFKIFAIDEAVKAGFRFIFWMDCVFQPIASIEPIWKYIEEVGWYIAPQGDSVLGYWVSDEALKVFGIDRPTAMTIKLLFSGLVGLDMQHELGQTIWKMWKELYEKGTFNGAHRNVVNGAFKPWGQKFEGHVSTDSKVAGHRHDESALSFILYHLKLTAPWKLWTTLESPQGIIRHGY